MRKKSLNLSLSNDAKKKGKELMKALNRPSLTNVVESLIVDEHRRRFPDGGAK